MSAFKLHTLKQKLWVIVAASFVARVIMFLVLPSTPSSLAPDEGTYATLAKWVSESKPANNFPGYSNLYLAGRSLFIPASILIRLGMNELNAVRLTSSIYGFLALCMVAYFVSKLPQFSGAVGNKKAEGLVITLVTAYAFLPSHFAWSSLGLRESVNEFWLIMAFIGVFLLFKDGQSKKLLLGMIIFISIVGTFSSRPQVGWVLVVSLLIYSLFRLRNKVTYLLICSALIGLLAGYFATTSFAYVTRDLYVAKESTKVSNNDTTIAPTNPGEMSASELCDGTKAKVIFRGNSYNCVKSGTETRRELQSNLAEEAINQVQVLPEKQVVNQVGAVSMIERLACPWEESSQATKYGCLIYRAPYMVVTFLFRPLPVIDTTGLSSTIASAENTIWIFMFVVVFYRIIKLKRIPFLKEISHTIVFFWLYIVGAASYQGNLGTAFRHKSLILLIVLLLLFAVMWRSQDEAKQPQGNNSQESAV